MAIAGLHDGTPASQDSVDLVEALLRLPGVLPFEKRRFRRSALHDVGVLDAEFARAARYLSDRLFSIFETAARRLLPSGLPLVISGGCGLNCEWNAQWRACGWFSDVFVPPCTNDSGSAIGTAIDAYAQLGGSCSVAWDVYCGVNGQWDLPSGGQWNCPLAVNRTARGRPVVLPGVSCPEA
jgi:hydroxymethyl cephem carbamoyltransferase